MKATSHSSRAPRLAAVAAVVAATIAAGVVCLGAATQDEAFQGRQGPPAPPLEQPLGANMTPAELQRWFDAYAVMQAQDQLSLSDEQYPKFLLRLRALQEVRRKSQQARLQILGDLRRMIGRPRAPVNADESQIRERLKALYDMEGRAAAELRKAYDAIDEILDVRQQARFRIFEEEVERRKLELLSRARRNVPNRPRPNQPPRQPEPRPE